MPVPDRPVSGEPIAADWGQEIHDRTITPKGTRLTTATTRVVNETAGGQHCHLDVVIEDPGGWLDAANDQAVAPAGSDGLYAVWIRLNTVDGSAGDGFQTRLYLYVNGSAFASALEDNAGGTNVTVILSCLVPITAGDELQVFAQRRGGGTNPTVKVLAFELVRLGDEVGT